MFKPKMVLEVKGLKDNIYRFESDPNVPLGEVHDALFTMKDIIVKQIQAQHEKEKNRPEEEKSSEKEEECCKKDEEKS